VRCPKCRYLSFEPEPRCKNCGYDLTFGATELPFNDSSSSGEPLADINLRIDDMTPVNPVSPSIDLDSMFPPAPSAEVSAPMSTPAAAARPISDPPTRLTTTELPLFVRRSSEPEREQEPDDAGDAILTLARSPRPPLAVRRPPPASKSRPKLERDAGAASPSLLELDRIDVPRAAVDAQTEAPSASVPVSAAVVADGRPAGFVRRVAAASIDALFMGGIDFAVFWLTLQVCGLRLNQAAVLPVLPLAAFLFLLNCGYLLLFTAANGQTIGKMALGIKVIGAPGEPVAGTPSAHDTAGEGRLTLKQAMVRSVLTMASVVPFGAGFVPALVGHDRRTLHDRFAHTRVVRA
jgi:uncharacterized RDD family membrane protein YckC